MQLASSVAMAAGLAAMHSLTAAKVDMERKGHYVPFVALALFGNVRILACTHFEKRISHI